MPLASEKDLLQGNLETVCQQAKDDIDAALWHFSRNQDLSKAELQTAIENLKMAVLLLA